MTLPNQTITCSKLATEMQEQGVKTTLNAEIVARRKCRTHLMSRKSYIVS